jgi:hypothetical protein
MKSEAKRDDSTRLGDASTEDAELDAGSDVAFEADEVEELLLVRTSGSAPSAWACAMLPVEIRSVPVTVPAMIKPRCLVITFPLGDSE